MGLKFKPKITSKPMVLLSPFFLFFAALAQKICPENCDSCSRVLDELDQPAGPWRCTKCRLGTSLCEDDQLCRANCRSTATETTTTTTTTTSVALTTQTSTNQATKKSADNAKTTHEATTPEKCGEGCLSCSNARCTKCLNNRDWKMDDGVCRSSLATDNTLFLDSSNPLSIMVIIMCVAVGVSMAAVVFYLFFKPNHRTGRNEGHNFSQFRSRRQGSRSRRTGRA